MRWLWFFGSHEVIVKMLIGSQSFESLTGAGEAASKIVYSGGWQVTTDSW